MSAHPPDPRRRVVLVEDDASIGGGVVAALDAHGYVTTWCRSGAELTAAAEAAGDGFADLVLLDVGLPDVDGFTLCRWLRERDRDLPIVIVTARDDEVDVIVGLDAGATDYVTKPFSTNVLLARVRAHLRATAERAQVPTPMEVGELMVDLGSYRATLEGVPLDLRPREFELLAYLVERAGRVVRREQILADVWDLHWESSSKTLDMHMMALRRKLGDRVQITSIRGVGFRLEAS